MDKRLLIPLALSIVVFAAILISFQIRHVVPSLLQLAGFEFDPLAGEPKIPPGFDVVAGEDTAAPAASAWVVQFRGPVMEQWKNAVTLLGLKLYDYIPDYAFIAKGTSSQIADARRLSFVRAVIPLRPAYKVSPELRQTLLAPASGSLGQRATVRVVPFDVLSPATRAQISSLGQVEEPRASMESVEGTDSVKGTAPNRTTTAVAVTLPLSAIASLAALPEVKYLEHVRPLELYNDVAATILKANEAWSGGGSGGGWTGQGQVVGIADTGLDSGVDDSSMHLDFQNRIREIYALGRPGDASDPHGHGTHVAGSVLGSGARSSGQIKGMAYGAELVFQSVMDAWGGLGGIPDDVGLLFAQAWDAGARIHSNSWGADTGGQYDTMASDVDRFVWNNDMAVFFAAGNAGPAERTVGSPAVAKNAISIGASENYRPDRGQRADNPDELAGFSSRGPTADRRIKPDLVAPGTWVLSTRSKYAPDFAFWDTYNQYYAYMGGTSMATPLAAGCATLVREAFEKSRRHTPSPALLKAALVAGARDMGMGTPSSGQGWGRIDVEKTLAVVEASTTQWDDQTAGLLTGQEKHYTYHIQTDAPVLWVVLAWSDFAGSPLASKSLVNDLDLTVTMPSGQVFRGNDFTAPYDDQRDSVNNVEVVRVSNPEPGTCTVRVAANNIPQGPQKFAVLMAGVGGDVPPSADKTPPSVAITYPNWWSAVSGVVNIKVRASDNVAVARVDYYLDKKPLGSSTSSPFTFQWDTTTVANGWHLLVAKAVDTSGNVGTSRARCVRVRNARR